MQGRTHNLKSARLRTRRRKVVIGTVVIVFLCIFGAWSLFFWLSSLSTISIQRIEISGNQLVSSAQIASSTEGFLTGRYFFTIPHRNIFFYPKDETPGCTTQSCSFRDASTEFSKHGAQIIGISTDDAISHKKFISKYSLPYPLLTDVGGKTASAFGVKKTLGLFAGRKTFVVDKLGMVQMADSSQTDIQRHVDDALATVKNLTVMKSGLGHAVPAN